MWNLLADFPDERTNRMYSGEHKPVARLIKNLQSKEYAKFVHVYTSLYTFVITLQPEYNSAPTDSIAISFDPRTGFFSISYGDIKSKLSTGYRCAEKQTESLIDAFVLRMFLTETNETLKIEPEEMPSFQIGQQVETVLDDYSRKFHKGTVYKIEKHHHQNRYMYFIEENGKKLKKRYFKDNLRAI